MGKEHAKTYRGIEISFDFETGYYYIDCEPFPFEFIWEATDYIDILISTNNEHSETNVRIECGIMPTEFYLN